MKVMALELAEHGITSTRSPGGEIATKMIGKTLVVVDGGLLLMAVMAKQLAS
jgi:hypothetical protein